MEKKRKLPEPDRIAVARAALEPLTPAERTKLLVEMGAECACKELTRFAKKNPGAALGALAGGVLGLAALASAKKVPR